jgi:hypothetical protein
VIKESTQFRGPCPERVNYRDDFELVAFRHRQLRRCPNPSRADLDAHEQWVQWAARLAWKKFYPVWIGAAYTREDLEQVGRVHLVTYLHMYRLEDRDQNIGLLLTYLRQRFGELAKLVNLKLACTKEVPMLDRDEDRVAELGEEPRTIPAGTWRFELPDGPRRLVVEEPTDLGWKVTLDGERIDGPELDRICFAVACGSVTLYPDHDPKEPPADPKAELRQGLATLPKKDRIAKLEALVEDSDPEIAKLAQTWRERIEMSGDLRVIPKDPAEVAELVEKARQKCYDATPAEVKCSRCGEMRPKDEYIIRVERNRKTRLPISASIHRYCKKCKREWTRANNAKKRSTPNR